jgi:hypothetical protein
VAPLEPKVKINKTLQINVCGVFLLQKIGTFGAK